MRWSICRVRSPIGCQDAVLLRYGPSAEYARPIAKSHPTAIWGIKNVRGSEFKLIGYVCRYAGHQRGLQGDAYFMQGFLQCSHHFSAAYQLDLEDMRCIEKEVESIETIVCDSFLQ